MNQLQKYMKLKNISARDLAERTGLKYCTAQKTVKGLRTGRITRRKIAAALDLDYDQAFGIKAGLYLRRLIKQEIERNADLARAEQRAKLQARFLGETKINQRVSNI